MTATEWLFKELWECDKDKLTWYSILEKAKQMESEQIFDAVEHHLDLFKETEISDEEIEKELNLLFAGNISETVVYKNCFRMGSKWYREQLKSKI